MSNEMGGIDYGAALSQFGSPENLAAIFKTFAAKIPEMLDTLKNQEAQALPAYMIHVHGIKGSLYGICAKEAGDVAAELEQYAKEGDLAAIKEKTPGFIALCETLLAGATDWLKANAAPGGTEEKERRPAPDTALLQKIAGAASRFKTSEIEKLVKELNAFHYESGGDLVEWLVKQSENLEYGAIVERLSSITE
ncbi:MAG: Hpt domain-containing protein [Spirochaetaceae bacterium]|jgi:HPt (histidine-containing phosphotransfer) domain-containing protein|nr:Hpt domain-containing protein [Spirochaetaceae bacterium]